MADTPRLDGLTLAVLQQALTSIGQANVRCLIVTGLNPTINGMSIVKTGQRLLVTSLLSFIYARRRRSLQQLSRLPWLFARFG